MAQLNDLGIDLGTSNVLIYQQGKGLVLRRPAVVAIERSTKKVLAIGDDAQRMVGRTLDIPTGDGGILASELLDTLPEKRYDVGIVPHVCDLNDPAVTDLLGRYENAKFINVKDDPIAVLTEIAQCRCILSSSLHGLIAADSFHIPNLHIVFSDRPLGDGYKFDDYYSAYGVQHSPRDLRVSAAPAIAEIRDGWRIRPEQVEEKKRQMRAAFPYPAVNGGSL